MYCKYCGKEISDNSMFCQYCGKSLNDKPFFNFDRIKQILNPRTKIKMFAYGITIILVITICWYFNRPVYLIRGKWSTEFVMGGEDIYTYNEDGTWSSIIVDCPYDDPYHPVVLKGSWRVSGRTLYEEFRDKEKIFSNTYKIERISRKKMVLRHMPDGTSTIYKRIKD